MERNFTTKVTKRTLLREVNNDMVHNFYYYIQGRIYNSEKTRYRKFSFVVWFDIFELQEWAFGEEGQEERRVTEKDKSEYLNESISSYLEFIKDYNDTDEFYKMCRESVEEYNR